MFGRYAVPILTIAGLALPLGTARAGEENNFLCYQLAQDHFYYCKATPTSAAFPTMNPAGWYTNTYKYPWFYPWYAYYNASQGPYANWAASGGVATYGYPKRLAPPGVPATVTIFLPAEAKLMFSGIPAEGKGAVRSFVTPPLEPNQEYGYEMTAEVIRDGRPVTLTKTVLIRAGEKVDVKFDGLESKGSLPPKK
jgi:uncharacterized protein (TIGR03000 family)